MPLPPWRDWGWLLRIARAFLRNPVDAPGAGDTVYCYRFACSVLQYYAQVTPLPDFTLVRGQYHGALAAERFDELAGLAGRGRVWVLGPIRATTSVSSPTWTASASDAARSPRTTG